MPKKVRIRATIPQDYAIALEALADLKGISWSELMLSMSRRELKAHGFEPPDDTAQVDAEELAAEIERRRKRQK